MTPFFFLEEELFVILSALASAVPSMLMSVAAYVLTAWALYTIALRRGISRPWLAWIPVANCWILGSLSDQYQYVVKGQDKSKRKILLVLKLLTALLGLTVAVMAMTVAAGVILAENEARAMATIGGPAMAILGLCVPMAAMTIAAAVIRYMALYDIYRSLDPANSVLFLVLSIFFGVTEPFFLFFNRNKDDGMPPRKVQEDGFIPPEPQDPEMWEYESL